MFTPLSSSSSSSPLSLLCVVRAPGRDLGRQRSRKQQAGAARVYSEEEGRDPSACVRVFVCVYIEFLGPAQDPLDSATDPWGLAVPAERGRR